ncbi:MAG: TonB-dependent receptor [Deltaproteobacteria bacterium]|nr:TonB-dependent receptor [Deltaproteobacteria bacterium]
MDFRLAALLLAVTLPTGVTAEEPEVKPAEEVVVTAPEPEAELDGGGLRERIDRLTLSRRAIGTTAEAVEEATGVRVQRTNLGGGSAYLRGLTGQQVLILLDGVRQNDATFRSGPNQYLTAIDPFLLDSVEVVRGPGSILYGSDAIGGVIALRLMPPSLSREGRTLGVAGNVQVATPTREKSGHLRLSAAYPGAAVYLAASYSDFDDLETPDGIVPFTGYQAASFAARGLALVGPGRAEVSYTSNRQLNVPRTDRCPSQQDLDAGLPFDCRWWDEQVRDQLSVAWVASLGPFDRLEARAHFKRSHEERLRIRPGREEHERDEVDSPGLRLEAELSPHERLRLRFGTDLGTDVVRSSAEHAYADGSVLTLERGRFTDGARWLGAGTFLLTDVRLHALVEAFAGGRLQLVHATASDPIFGEVELTPLSALGAAGLRLFPGEPASVDLEITQGFRAPNLDDLSALGPFGGGFDVPNVDLGPERSTAYQASLRLGLGVLRAELAGFLQQLRGAIVRAPAEYEGSSTYDDGGELLTVYQRVNTGEARIFGGEARIDLLLEGGLSATVSASFARGDDLSEDTPLSRVSPPLGQLVLRYHRPGGGPELEGVVRVAGAQRRLAPRDLSDSRICPAGPAQCEGTEGYVVFDLRVGVPFSEKVRADLALKNVGNTRYRVHGSGIDGAGLGASLRLTWSY